MKTPVNTRKLTTLSLLAAIALALYAVESTLPPIVPIPGIKLGLANIITLVVLWKYSAKDAFFVLLVRILLATLFFGQAISLLYSLSGGILCLSAMVLVKRLLHGHYLFLASMTGAVFHNLGQIGVAGHGEDESVSVFHFFRPMQCAGAANSRAKDYHGRPRGAFLQSGTNEALCTFSVRRTKLAAFSTTTHRIRASS